MFISSFLSFTYGGQIYLPRIFFLVVSFSNIIFLLVSQLQRSLVIFLKYNLILFARDNRSQLYFTASYGLGLMQFNTI